MKGLCVKHNKKVFVVDEKLATSIVFRLSSPLSECFIYGSEISLLGVEWKQINDLGVLRKSSEQSHQGSKLFK